ncbi:hypothetical protein G7046_g1036 [Stylonectria norvegica]|nr:hypothetical protein G7046_g1036 [Stylonectria norvegica]
MDTNPTWDWSSVGNGAAQPSPTKESPPRPSEDFLSQSKEVPQSDPRTEHTEHTEPRPESHAESRTTPKGKNYGPRTCRICFDMEEPKYPTATTTFGVSSASSRPTYTSDDPELGRLLSPCKCKGSQKYVHEGCLTAWRLANPTEARNYWQCPTCKFTYRIDRLQWASALSSKWAQFALTFVILVMSIFILGFIADPIFDLWADPVGTISDTVTSVVTDIEALKELPQYEPTTWSEHFVKGFFSLGIVGLAKGMLAMSPWQWWNLRSSGVMGNTGRRQGTGRARVENINVIFVTIGAFTFMMGIWTTVKALSARVLQNMSDRVIDVDADDDEDEVGEEATKSAESTESSQESKKEQ